MPAVRKLINVPQTTDPVNFAPRADSLLATQFNNTVDDINFVADAMTLNATNDTSTSSVLIGLGVKSFTVSLNKSFVPGMALLFADTAAGSANWMLILTDTYNPATGAFTGTCIKFAGSGTKAAWSISQSVRGGDLATVNLSGPINFAQGTIAFNATTMDILGQPNTVIVTGSGTLTALPDSAQAGIYRRIKWSGAVVLATTGNITSANGTITTAAGMYSDVYYDSTSLKSITTYLADGTSAVPATVAPLFSLNADLVGGNVATVQSLFGVSASLEASSIYEFEIITGLIKSAGTTSHTLAMGFGGSATLNNIVFHVDGQGSTAFNTFPTSLSNIYSFVFSSAASVVITTALTSAASTHKLIIKGRVSINAAGTFTPQYTLSAAPGGAYSTISGSTIKMKKLGASGANINVGFA